MYRSYKKIVIGKLEGDIQDGLGKVGAIVEKQAKINVSQSSGHPQVQTGRLRSSIGFKVDKKRTFVEIGTNVYYGIYLEFGTTRHPPYPWLFPAVEMKKKEIVEALKG